MRRSSSRESLNTLSTATAGYRSAADIAHYVSELLGKTKAEGWTGTAADEFHASLAKEPPKWKAAGTALGSIADALDSYLAAFRVARSHAEDAAYAWETAMQSTQRAKTEWEEDAKKHPLRGDAANASPLTFADPGLRDRLDAEEKLARARKKLAAVADETHTALVEAEKLRPDTSNGWEQFWDWVGKNVVPFPGKVVEGAVKSEWETLSALLTLNIDDLWTGLAELFRNPAGVAKAMLDEELAAWAKDPANALGADLLALATLGFGSGLKAAKLTADAGKAAKALTAAEKAAELAEKATLAAKLRKQFEALAGAGVKPYGDLSPSQWFEKYYKGPIKSKDGKVIGGDWNWPENNGFAGAALPNDLEVGDTLERLTPRGEDGRFATDAGTPFSALSLPPDRVGPGFERVTYRVNKPLPESVLEGEISPWFEQPGGGNQYFFPQGIDDLVDQGYLTEIERVPN